MDPLTAALNLCNTIADIVKLELESATPDVRAERARIHLEELQHWRAFLEQLRGGLK